MSEYSEILTTVQRLEMVAARLREEAKVSFEPSYVYIRGSIKALEAIENGNRLLKLSSRKNHNSLSKAQRDWERSVEAWEDWKEKNPSLWYVLDECRNVSSLDI